MKTYYDAKYFDWQKDIGKFGGMVNGFHFSEFISPSDSVLDFGAGGGYILSNLTAKNKLGIEINDEAREASKEIGVPSVQSIDEVPDNWADIIISNNALEHTHEPFAVLKDLFKKLKSGGKMIFIFPCETIAWEYKPGDINQHLYSWGPMTAGNLFTLAGYNVLESASYPYKWPNNYQQVFEKLGKDPQKFYEYARNYALKKEIKNLKTTWHHVRVVAEKKN